MLNRRAFFHTVGATAAGAVIASQPQWLQAQGQGRRNNNAAMDGQIRIGGNENPYGPGIATVAAVNAAALIGNRYPGPAVDNLQSAIARRHGVPGEWVLLSGGSGDLLRAIVTTYTSKSAGMVTGLPSYESPGRTAQQVGAPIAGVPLTTELRLDLPAMASKAPGAGLVYVCNPNNPTSTVVPAKDVEELIAKVSQTSPQTMILVDEAYFEYADHPGFATAIPLIAKYPNVIVARTFSKIHAMAGMRVGYATAQPAVLTELRKVHSNSGLSVMSLSAALASFTDTANTEKNRALNRTVRAMVVDGFQKAGYNVAASDANFVFVNVRRDSREFQEAVRAGSVGIGRAFPPMTTWSRISIGTKEEMDKAMDVMLSVLSKPAQATSARALLDIHPDDRFLC